MKFIRLLLLIPIALLTACHNPDHRAVFLQDEARFKQVLVIRDSLLSKYHGCKVFRFTYTAKAFWQECTSPEMYGGAGSPAEFLTADGKDFFLDFMSDNDLRIVEIDSQRVKYFFSGYDPDVVIRTRTDQDKYFGQYKLDSLFYLLPGSENWPE